MIKNENEEGDQNTPNLSQVAGSHGSILRFCNQKEIETP